FFYGDAHRRVPQSFPTRRSSDLFLLESLPAWHGNRISRLIKTPKLHLTDTGLACALLGVEAQALWKDRALFGQLLETFVCQELRDRKSTRLNSSHVKISYAVFCL